MKEDRRVHEAYRISLYLIAHLQESGKSETEGLALVKGHKVAHILKQEIPWTEVVCIRQKC
jgi:hypothetical protein